MKMKSISVVLVVISLACLFALFHSCHGIECYACHSTNFENQACETVDGKRFIYNYGVNADICIKMVVYSKSTEGNDTTDRILDRYGYMQSGLPTVRQQIEEQRNRGDKVDFYFCKTHLCNNG